MANPVKILGAGIVYLGLGAMFVMAVIGAFSLDILYLILLSRFFDRSGSNFIVSLLVWNMMLSSRDSLYENIGYSLVASPFISALSIGLSFAAGVPEFGVLLLLGWTGAFTIVLAGAVVYGIGDAIGAAFTSMTRGSETTFSFDIAHAHMHRQQPLDSRLSPACSAAQAANYASWEDQQHFTSPTSAVKPSAPYVHDKQDPPPYDAPPAYDTAAFK